jgi:hypothetical protein
MITDEDTKAAYDRAAALDARSPEGREAWSEYWGLVETRREQLRIMRGEDTPLRVVPRFEDTLSKLLDLFEAEDRVRAESISALPLSVADGA